MIESLSRDEEDDEGGDRTSSGGGTVETEQKQKGKGEAAIEKKRKMSEDEVTLATGVAGDAVESVELHEQEEKYTGGVAFKSYMYLANSMSPFLVVVAVGLTYLFNFAPAVGAAALSGWSDSLGNYNGTTAIVEGALSY